MTPGLFPAAPLLHAMAAPTYNPPPAGTLREGKGELEFPSVTKDQDAPAPAANSWTATSASRGVPFQAMPSVEALVVAARPYQICMMRLSAPS